MWTPTGPDLFVGLETGSFHEVITYTPDSSTSSTGGSSSGSGKKTVTRLTYKPVYHQTIPTDNRFEITQNQQTEVEIRSTNLLGLMPPHELRYTDEGTSILVNTWSDIPFGAKVHKYVPNKNQQIIFTFEVTAELSDATSESQTYNIIIQNDYNIGKQNLLQKIKEEIE